MKKTEYESVADIEQLFDTGWVPFKKGDVGYGESGVLVQWIMDKKSKVLYIERYNSITDDKTVYSFDEYSYPKEWTLEEGGKTKNILQL